jgi:hypothetical protein
MVSLTPPKIAHYLQVIFKPKPNMANVDWVAFKNGTFAVFSQAHPARSRQKLIEDGEGALKYYAGIGSGAGSSYGDFAAHFQDNNFPDENVWIVTFDHPSIMTLVVFDEATGDMQAGLCGRGVRAVDADDPVVVATSLDDTKMT